MGLTRTTRPRDIFLADVAEGRRERLDLREPATAADPLGLASRSDIGPRPILRDDRPTFAPNLNPLAVAEGLRSSRETANGVDHGESATPKSPLGTPRTGGPVLPI